MGLTKWTPGPWKKIRNKTKGLNENWNFISIMPINGDKSIATIPFIPDNKMCVKLADANATLMMLSPDLYEALHEAAYEICTRSGDDHCPNFDSDMETCSEKDGKCFVQRWWKLLRKANGKK